METPYFMEIITSISIWLQLTNNISSLAQLGFFKINLNFDFYLICSYRSLEHYEAWKDEEPIWSKTEIQLSKNVKFHFYPAFWAILRIYQQFHCKIYVWRWCETKLIFVAQAIVFHPYFMEITSFISIGLQFSHYSSSKLLKNFMISNFCHF